MALYTKELLKKVAKTTSIPISDAELIWGIFQQELKMTLAKGRSVYLDGFVTLNVLGDVSKSGKLMVRTLASLYNDVASQTTYSIYVVQNVVESVLSVIKEYMVLGESVNISNFLTFKPEIEENDLKIKIVRSNYIVDYLKSQGYRLKVLVNLKYA